MFHLKILGRNLLVGSTQQMGMVEDYFRAHLAPLLISTLYLRTDSLEMG